LEAAMVSPMKKYRVLKELTLDDLYLRTNIDISRLSRIERGIFVPTEKEKKLIAKAIKAKPEELFKN
jgi:transcriptional regulator with XRE-family HTH domain